MRTVTHKEALEIMSYREAVWCRGTTLSVQRYEREGWEIFGRLANSLVLQYLMVRKKII